MSTLSKSDFQLASTCAKKLVYKKAEYNTSNDTNEYMKMLAQGGYIIGEMAKFYYPGGIEIEGSTQECIMKTNELMQTDKVTLFEAAIQEGQKLARIDILIKDGKKIDLIEVKAKSIDTTSKKIKNELARYIEDVAYQYMIISKAYPEHEIACYLLMPDKSKRTQIDGLAGWFLTEKGIESDGGNEEIISQIKTKFNKPKVVFKYETHPQRQEYINELIGKGILSLLEISEEVQALQPEIIRRSNSFIKILNEGITEKDHCINKECKKCEFKTPIGQKNGFNECWGKSGETSPHIFDLYYGGSMRNESKHFIIDDLIHAGKTSLFDFDIEKLKGKSDENAAIAKRQIIQIENTRNNTEWISTELKFRLHEFEYPLHFIDFETYTGAVPFHKGMRPYELIAFQWSCHTIEKPGDKPRHSEWIHTGEMFPEPDVFPNFVFARALMNTIGYAGTPFMWAKHENTVLKGILSQMEEFGHEDEVLEAWLKSMTRDNGREGRLVDMNQMTLQYYFHPDMKGKTSIKKVLPAIWSHFHYLHTIPHFKNYAPVKLLEGIIDPYDTLVADLEFSEEEDVVSGGTDAMRAYYRIRFDDTLSVEWKVELRRQLLEYCKLDTMAMVIIAYHWGLK